MTSFETCLSAAAVGISACSIAYTCYVVRTFAVFERPTDAQIRHMLNTAPPKEEDNETAT